MQKIQPFIIGISHWLNPPRCLLCTTKNTEVSSSPLSKQIFNLGLCQSCLASLPWIVSACPVCSTPYSTSLNRSRQHNQHNDICGTCLSRERHWRRCLSAFAYQTPIKSLIADYKYHNAPQLSHTLAKLFYLQLLSQPKTPLPEALIPVPTSKTRLKYRGYNQSLQLSRSLSQLLNIPTINLLKKVRDTPPQQELASKERIITIRNSFALNGSISALSSTLKTVAIIDDVMTTGSTTTEIAKLLKKSGISNVDVWVLART